MFTAQGNKISGYCWHETSGDMELIQEESRWVDPDSETGTVAQHSKQVISIPATYVEHGSAVKISDMWLNSLPLPV